MFVLKVRKVGRKGRDLRFENLDNFAAGGGVNEFISFLKGSLEVLSS